MPTPELHTGTISAPTSLNAPVDFFKLVYERFQKAGGVASNTVERDYLIGGLPVRLYFAGNALVEFITPAFEHLAVPSTESPSLKICLWDSFSTGIAMPSPPWSAEDYRDRGTVHGYNNERIRTSFHMGSGILSLLDIKDNIAVWWIRDAANVPYYESGTPLQTILQWFMGIHNRQYIHAAAVGTTSGGVLLAGKGGSGKSTVATACLFSNLKYAGDDYVLINVDISVPVVHSLYNSVKLNDAIFFQFPELTSISYNTRIHDDEKKLLFYYRHFPEKVIESFPVRAILLPQITHEKNTTIQKVTSAAALAALAPSTIFQLASAGDDEFRRMSKFVRKVPAFALKLGTELSKIPEVILTLLAKV